MLTIIQNQAPAALEWNHFAAYFLSLCLIRYRRFTLNDIKLI